MLVILILFSLVSFVNAACSDSDGGNYPAVFGYVTVDSVVYKDVCISSTKITEYYCSGNSKLSTTASCSGCNDGICYSTTCSTANECNPVLQKWCDGSSWLSSSYCTDSNVGCYLIDSSCSSSTCTEGACDYKNHKYCKSNEWLSDDYCDNSLCGTDDNSRGYCYCSTTLTTEVYCTDDKDDDCDGSIDCHDSDCVGMAGCECTDGETESCGSTVGECVIGAKTCVDGSWGICSGVEAESENCDYKDNDCDGEIDEDCTCVSGDTRDCGENVGVCKAGMQVCQSDNSWSICYGASYSASEIESCNGLDDDCDNLVDEGCECIANSTQICGSDVGACTQGLQTCINGSWDDCNGDIEAFPEICGDLIDNDCDDFVDYDDDTCSSKEIVVNNSIIETEVECVSNLDCGDSYECKNSECIVIRLVSDTSTIINKSTSTTSLSSSGVSTTKSESSLLIPIIIIFLVLAVILFFVFKNKKSNLPKSESKVYVTNIMKNNFISNPKITRKSILDKDIESSFKESKELFKK